MTYFDHQFDTLLGQTIPLKFYDRHCFALILKNEKIICDFIATDITTAESWKMD